MEEEGWPWKIPLTKNKVVVDWALCSEEDYEALSRHKWSINKNGYAKFSNGQIAGQTFMHRYVKHVLEGIPIEANTMIDHVNNNRVDNRRDKLRVATHKQNAQNKRKREDTKSSQWIGVKFEKGRYRSFVSFNGKRCSLGGYDLEIDAAKARDVFILNNTPAGETVFYTLNFPELAEEHKLMKPYVLQPRVRPGKFRNVSFNTRENIFKASIRQNQKCIFSFYSKSDIECAKAFDAFVVSQKLDRPLNFPSDYPDYVPVREIKTQFQLMNNGQARIIITKRPDVIVLVDMADYETTLKYFTFHIHTDQYVKAQIAPNEKYLLHRYLLNVKDPSVKVDHIDGNGFNNCRSNLRISTDHQNGQNKKKSKKSSSVYFGVFKERNNRFVALIDDKTFYYYKTHLSEMHAARDRDLTIMKMLPTSFYKLNFEWTPFKIKVWADILKNKYYKENSKNRN